MSDQTLDLRSAIASYLRWLKAQLAACESGKFKVYSVENGQQIDLTPDHVAQLKRMIAEHEQLLEGK